MKFESIYVVVSKEKMFENIDGWTDGRMDRRTYRTDALSFLMVICLYILMRLTPEI